MSELDACAHNLPYPPVRVLCQNEQTVNLIRPLYAGAAGELTAIAQYLYQELCVDSRYPDLAALLERISIAEMRHLQLLGELIVQLGGDPQYYAKTPYRRRGNANQYWNASFVNYEMDARAILTENIRAEEAAMRAYQDAICAITEEGIRALLRRICMDEQMHLKEFQCALADLSSCDS